VDASGDFAVVAAEWFDGTVRRAAPASFLVSNGRLVEIAAGDHGAAFAARGIAVQRGGFLMPGLVDAHVHLFLQGCQTDGKLRAALTQQPFEQLVETARRNARRALACGVTLLRDAGDRHGVNDRVRAESLQPGSGLPRIRSGGVGLKRAGRYGSFMAIDVTDARSIRAAVAELARGSDEIKLILTGIIDFAAGAVTGPPQFTLAQTRVVVEAAHAAGRKVFAHCSGAAGLEIAVAAGVDSVEHGFFMSRGILARMRDRDMAWTATFCPLEFQWRHPEAAGWSRQAVDNLRRMLDEHAAHLRLAHEMGVRLLLGTDAGSVGVEHGQAVREEVGSCVAAGVPLAAVLQAATSVPRRHFGEVGAHLRRGAPFDAALFAASPFERLEHLGAPLATWVAAATAGAG
jgi:imidazolonepropionase-like amidohydrolase